MREIDGRPHEVFWFEPHAYGLIAFSWLLRKKGRLRDAHIQLARSAKRALDHAEYLLAEDGRRVIVAHIYDHRARAHLVAACQTFGLVWAERVGVPTWREGTRLEVSVGPAGAPLGFEERRGAP